MRSSLYALILLLVSNGGVAQSASPHLLKPLTVCEVLDGIQKLRGKKLAVVGRLDCEWNPTDHASCFLAETQCTRPLIIGGHTWPFKIYLYDSEMAPHTSSKLNDAALITKLQAIETTTTLGFHKELVQQSKDGKMAWVWADVIDEWGVAYGQVSLTPNLKPNPRCASEGGCQAYEQTPVALLMDWQTLATFSKEFLRQSRGSQAADSVKEH